MFDLDDIVKLSHKSEDLLDLIRQGKIVFTKDIGALFLEIRDVVSKLVELTKDNSKPNTILAQQILEIYGKLEASKVIQPEVKTINKPVVAKKTILIVDDASLIRNLASKAAQEAGFDSLEAKDGYEAIELLKNKTVDLIFSDVNMPNMDGMEMVKNIKQDPQYEFLPIVMLTTEKSPQLKQQGKTLGVRAWLVKPFNKNKFLMALEKLLG